MSFCHYSLHVQTLGANAFLPIQEIAIHNPHSYAVISTICPVKKRFLSSTNVLKPDTINAAMPM